MTISSASPNELIYPGAAVAYHPGYPGYLLRLPRLSTPTIHLLNLSFPARILCLNSSYVDINFIYCGNEQGINIYIATSYISYIDVFICLSVVPIGASTKEVNPL